MEEEGGKEGGREMELTWLSEHLGAEGGCREQQAQKRCRDHQVGGWVWDLQDKMGSEVGSACLLLQLLCLPFIGSSRWGAPRGMDRVMVKSRWRGVLNLLSWRLGFQGVFQEMQAGSCGLQQGGHSFLPAAQARGSGNTDVPSLTTGSDPRSCSMALLSPK